MAGDVEDEYYGYDVDTLASQFDAVRNTGAVNMHNRHGVIEVADEAGFEELYAFCHRCENDEYMDVLRYMGREY